MQMTKKVLSVVLAVMMVVSMMTVMAVSANAATAVAKVGDTNYESLEDAIAAISTVTTEYHNKSDLTIKKYKANGTITLLADCEGNGIVIDSGSNLTIDFNGKKYSVTGDLVGSNGTETLGFQLLKDSSVTFKNGTIYSEKAKMLVMNYSNLTLDNMTLTLNNSSYTGAYTLSNNNGNVVIDDTTINANPAGGFAFDVCRYSSYPSVNVTVKGDSTINGDVEVSASNGNAGDGFSLNLESGKMTGDVVVDSSATTAMNATPEKGKIVQDDTDFTMVDDPAAQIGSTKYETLEEAFAAAQDGATITLLKNSAGNGIIAPQGKFGTDGLTVDFAGYTYTVDGAILAGSTGTKTQAFQLLKDNKITFKNGTIYSEVAKMIVQNYSNLTLDNMILTIDNPNYAYAYTLSNNNGSAVIKDTIINANPAGGFAFDVCRFSSYPSIDVTVTGNSVINGDVEISASGSDAKDGFSLTLESGTIDGDIVLDATAKTAMANTPDKVEITKKAAFAEDAPTGYVWVDNNDGTQSLGKVVATIGNTGYASLEAAFAAAVDGDTIEVVADCAGNGIKVTPAGKFATGLTVDFNGHTYTVDGETVGSTGTETLAFQLLKNNKVTFENGTIYSEKAKMLVQNYCDLTLDNMTLTLNNTSYNGAYTLSNNNGSAVIKDTTINANPTTGSFAFDVCRYSSYPSIDVTVTGDSVINGNVEIYASKGQAKDGFTLTLDSGTMNGNIVLDPTAEKAMAATPDITDVAKKDTFNQAAPAGYEWVSNNDGTSSLVLANPLDPAMAKANDNNSFGITSNYLRGTLLGFQKKDEIATKVDGADHTSESNQETGNDIRFVAVLKTDILQDADDYGFVLAKVNNKTFDDTKFENLKAFGGNGEKTVSAKDTWNNVCGNEAYGDPTNTTTPYKYITCAVNGIDDGDQIVARFYVKKDGKTYYAKYAGQNYQFTGCLATL